MGFFFIVENQEPIKLAALNGEWEIVIDKVSLDKNNLMKTK